MQDFLTTHADKLGGLAAHMATVRRLSARQELIAAHMRGDRARRRAERPNYGELSGLHMPRLSINYRALVQKARAMASATSTVEGNRWSHRRHANGSEAFEGLRSCANA